MDTSTQGNSLETSAKTLMDRVRDGATAQLSTQKERATSSLGSIARAVRDTSEPLRNNQQAAIAQYVERAADQIDRFSNQLRDRDVNELIDDVQQFARRQPALFIGAAFAAGVLAARFFKSSSAVSSRSNRSILRSDNAYGSRGNAARTAYGTESREPRYAGGGL